MKHIMIKVNNDVPTKAIEEALASIGVQPSCVGVFSRDPIKQLTSEVERLQRNKFTKVTELSHTIRGLKLQQELVK